MKEKKPSKFGMPLKASKDSLERLDIENIIARGLIISGNIGCGKSDIAKHISFEIYKRNLANQRIFDVVYNWCWNCYTTIPSQDINKTTTKCVLEKAILYNLNFDSVEERANFIKALTRFEYKHAKLMKAVKAKKRAKILYIIEEANVILNTKTVRGFWLDFVSLARNFGQTGVYIMQRLADSSTKVIERIPNYIFGQTRGQNDIRKIRGMFDLETWKKLRNQYILPNQLEKHEFLCLIGKNVFKLKLPQETIDNFNHETISVSESEIDAKEW